MLGRRRGQRARLDGVVPTIIACAAMGAAAGYWLANRELLARISQQTCVTDGIQWRRRDLASKSTWIDKTQ